MAHSEDLRLRVVKYIRQGGSKAEAARRFDVARGSIFQWLKMDEKNLRAGKPGPRGARKVDMEKLSALVLKRNDLMLKEMAKIFDVHESTISKAFKRISMSRKKNDSLRGG